ncbi:MAG: alkaline phosphatase family protein [Methylococcales bacterium]|nr:alkaline phosphatase family protein [Methylococcales bacterium]
MNILFITADQWRGECLSSLGHPHVRTPNLDTLAASGVSFKRHYAQTTPCGPSRASLYTGMYLQNHRSVLNGTPLDSRHTNLALETRKAGYEPTLFGYTDVSLDPRPFDHGDIVPGGYEGVLPGMTAKTLLTSDWQLWLEDLAVKGYELPQDCWGMFEPQAAYPGSTGKGKTFSPSRFKSEDSPTAFLVDQVMDYVSNSQNTSAKTPWFVHLSLYSPHPPFIVPEPFHAMYDAEDMPLPVRRTTPQEEAAQHPWLEYFMFNQRGKYYTYNADSRDNLSVSDLDLRQIKATYYGMMSEVDAQVGRLLNHLQRLECYDDTLIIFTSDHGEQLGDHWMFAKYGYHDQTFNTPLIIRDPSSAANSARGSVVKLFTESVDIMPTILNSIGLDIPDHCDGFSLLPFCRGIQPENWRQEYHAEFDLRSPYEIDEDIPLGLDMKKCTVNIICGERYKYVHFNGLPPLFFDRKNDPNEFHDLSNDPAYQGLVLEYAQKMLSWRMDHDDQALTHLHLENNGTVRNLRTR